MKRAWSIKLTVCVWVLQHKALFLNVKLLLHLTPLEWLKELNGLLHFRLQCLNVQKASDWNKYFTFPEVLYICSKSCTTSHFSLEGTTSVSFCTCCSRFALVKLRQLGWWHLFLLLEYKKGKWFKSITTKHFNTMEWLGLIFLYMECKPEELVNGEERTHLSVPSSCNDLSKKHSAI